MTESKSRFQFSLLSALSLTTVCAGILALLRPLQLPTLVHVGLAAYAILLSGYLVLRGFFQLRRSFLLRKSVLDTRRELSDWVDKRRRDLEQQNDADVSAPTSNDADGQI